MRNLRAGDFACCSLLGGGVAAMVGRPRVFQFAPLCAESMLWSLVCPILIFIALMGCEMIVWEKVFALFIYLQDVY